LRPYQQRWIDDDSRFKCAVKSARIGYSFATGLEAILDCLEHPNTTWTILSASKAQSNEFIETSQKLVQLMRDGPALQ
jgi:phage FluMu gp28-like protein